MHYNAFISYRHGELDGLAAEKLHRMLENYRVPKKLARKIGKDKIKRVFRDRDELPTSADLSESIDEALRNSEFLILICSKRTKESMWVMREVERFTELHGQERIIALLIEGEPYEAFPEQICTRVAGGKRIAVEPLAADIRSGSNAKSIKLLKSEKLRIIAPVLGCAYDDLRQRHRDRKIKRITAASTVTAAGILAFGSFSFYQYMQINEQMKEKLINQSYVLAEYSNGALLDGDPVTAALLALEALPKNLDNPERALVEAAEKSLADALRYYNIKDGFDYHRLTALPAPGSKVIISPSGTYTAALYSYSLAVIGNESGNLEAEWNTAPTALADAEFLSDEIIVFSGADGLTAVNVKANKILWVKQGEYANEIAVSADKSTLAAVNFDNDYAVLYDKDGNEIKRINFNGKHLRKPNEAAFLNPRDNIFELDENGETLAVSFTDGKVVLFGDDINADILVVNNPENEYFNGFFNNGMFMYSTVARGDYKAMLGVYRLSDNMDLVLLESFADNFVISADAADGELYYAGGSYIVSVDRETGDRFIVAGFDNDIINFKVHNGVFLVSTDDGKYYFYDMKTAPMVSDGKGNLFPMPDGGSLTVMESGYTCGFLSINGDYAALGSYDSPDVRILKNKSFENQNILTYDTAYQWSEAKVNAGETYAVFMSYKGFRTVNIASGDIIAEAEFPDSEKTVNVEYFKDWKGVAAVYDGAFKLYETDTGELVIEEKDCASIFLDETGIHYLKDGIVYYLDLAAFDFGGWGEAGNGADFGYLLTDYVIIGKDNGLIIKNRASGEEHSLGQGTLKAVYNTGIGNYKIAAADEHSVKIYSVNGGAVKLLSAPAINGKCEIYFLNGGNDIAIAPYNGTPAVYNADSGKETAELKRDGYLARVYNLNEKYIISTYISTSGRLYSLLLNAENYQPLAEVPWLCDYLSGNRLLINDEAGNLRTVPVHDIKTLVREAESLTDGREFTKSQKNKYHI